jgi:hypothetical protein
MGVVYQARHGSLERLVALKMLLGGAFADAEDRARFRAEALAAARLQHPHVVQLFEVGEHQGLPYLAMEFIDGDSLQSRLAGKPLPPRQAAGWLEPLARAVHYAHRQGVVHRDLKPSNVLLTRDGVPKLCDFGVAKLVGGELHTPSGMLVGTPEYAAPEQASGRAEVGPASDVYALGALLYTMLTGRPPFQSTDPLQTLIQMQTRDPVPPSRLQPGCPRDLETVCLKCLEKDTRRRYASAEHLAEDLARFLAGEPVRARPVGALGRLLRWCRRRPGLALVSGLALAALVAAGAVSLLFVLYQGRALEQSEGQRRELGAANERLEQTDRRRREFTRLAAVQALDQGLSLCARGDADRGLILLAFSLQIAPPEDEHLQRTLRLNLAAWGREVHPLRAFLPHPGGVTLAVFSPDGRTLLTAGEDRAGRGPGKSGSPGCGWPPASPSALPSGTVPRCRPARSAPTAGCS